MNDDAHLYVKIPVPVLRDDRLRRYPHAKLVYGALALFQGNNPTAWPGVRAIAERVGCGSNQTAADAINRLVKTGWIDRRPGGNGRKTHYTVKRPTEWSAPTASAPQRLGRLAPQRLDGSAPAARTEDDQGIPSTDNQGSSNVPPALEGLELYQADPKLCEQWPALSAAFAKAYPTVDLEAELAKAHAWEMARPPSKRKKDRPKFLRNWMDNASQKQTEQKRSTAADDGSTDYDQGIVDPYDQPWSAEVTAQIDEMERRIALDELRELAAQGKACLLPGQEESQ